MDDTIEICSGCGKMPRSIDNMNGYFLCTRCGNRSTTQVSGEEYEKIVTELDRKFHEALLKHRHEAVSKEPIKFTKAKKSAKAKPAKAKPAKKTKAAKKASPKKKKR